MLACCGVLKLLGMRVHILQISKAALMKFKLGFSDTHLPFVLVLQQLVRLNLFLNYFRVQEIISPSSSLKC